MERYNANSDLYRTLPLSELLSLRGKTIVVTGKFTWCPDFALPE